MQSFDHVRRGGMLSRSSAPLTFDAIYPVGSIITTTDPYFNPNNASGWSGTWERLNRKCFLYQDVEHPGQYAGAYEKTYNCSSTTLDLSQIPSHSHTLGLACDSAGAHTHTTGSTSTSDNGLHHHNVNGESEYVQGHYHTLDLNTVGYPDETMCHIHKVWNNGYRNVDCVDPANTRPCISKERRTDSGYDLRFDTTDIEFFDDHQELGVSDADAWKWAGGHIHKILGNTSFQDGHVHDIDLDTTNAGTHAHDIPSLTTNSTGAHTHDIYGEAATSGGGQSHNHNVTFHVDDFQHYNCIFWVRTA